MSTIEVEGMGRTCSRQISEESHEDLEGQSFKMRKIWGEKIYRFAKLGRPVAVRSSCCNGIFSAGSDNFVLILEEDEEYLQSVRYSVDDCVSNERALSS